MNAENLTYFDTFGVKHTSGYLYSGYFYIGFIDFMLKGECLLDYINLFSPNHYEKNSRTILKYFQ